MPLLYEFIFIESFKKSLKFSLLLAYFPSTYKTPTANNFNRNMEICSFIEFSTFNSARWPNA